MKAKTFWRIIGLVVLGLLAWIGIRAYRNHLRREEELSEYDHDGLPPLESSSEGQNHPESETTTTH